MFIIDESHKNNTTASFRDVITPLNPKIIINVSATPEEEPTASDINHYRAEFVEVEREEVISAGLIKKEIISQTEEDLNAYGNEDHDLLLLDLAMEKREMLLKEWRLLGQNVNPLVLIQLPDDDKKLRETNSKSKEEIVMSYLQKKGIAKEHIACWFDNRRQNMENIEDNDNPVKYMLFKYAAGTGWDCPRAHVIVMYREIKSNTFKTQTLGRILRMPVPGLSLTDCPMLEKGYLFTNYSRNEVANPVGKSENQPKTITASIDPKHLTGQLFIDWGNEFKSAVENTITSEDSKRNAVATITELAKDFATTANDINSIKSTEKDAYTRREKIEQKKKEFAKKVQEKTGELLDSNSQITEEEKAKAIAETITATEKAVDTMSGKRVENLIIDPILKTEFNSREDYGDLGKGSEFQPFLKKSLNEYFGFDQNEITDQFTEMKHLQSKGVEVKNYLNQDILVDAKFSNFENQEDIDWGRVVKKRVSVNDLEKHFTWKCYEILEGQSEDNSKIGNLSRSWGIMKSGLRSWFKSALCNMPELQCYATFVNDVNRKERSVFIKAINMALHNYSDTRTASIARKRAENEAREARLFSINTQPCFPKNYVVFEPSAKSLIQPFYLPDTYKGGVNEKRFIEFLEASGICENIEWWLKNGTDKESLGFRYTDSTSKERRIFYPDWIIKFKDGRIGIFDTKGGITADSSETKDKAEELAERIDALNSEHQMRGDRISYIGGIVIFEDDLWWYNNNKKYRYYRQAKDDWKHFNDLFSVK